MNTQGGSVPIVISYRKVTKKPQIQRTRHFVGLRGIVSNLVLKAIEFVEEVCYETEQEVLDAGEQTVVHWAVEVDDPWSGANESQLVAVRVPEKPACGAAFEIISFVEQPQPQPQQVSVPVPEPPLPALPVTSPLVLTTAKKQQQEAVRARMRERINREIGRPVSGNHTGNNP